MIQVRFAGIGCVGDFNFSLRHGVTPSTGSIAFPVQFTPPLVGDLFISDGYTSIVFREMYLVDPVRTQSESGDIIQATLADRRLLWQHSSATGEFNLPDEGTGQPKHELSLAGLFDFLFAAYGIWPTYILVPTVWPSVSWDHINPGTAAQELMSKYGLSLGLDNNGRVYISPANQPRAYPPGDFVTREYTMTPKPMPSLIRVVGNRVVKQGTYTLKPVGIEINGSDPDGTIKEIADLSYKPSAGWGKSWLIHFTDVKSEFGDDEYRLALKCVYKWYAYIPTDTGYDKRQYTLPWLSHIKRIVKVPNTILDDEEQRDRPYVLVAEAETDGVKKENMSTAKETKRSYTLDHARGIVKFDADDVVLKVAAGSSFVWDDAKAADVSIVAAHERKYGQAEDFYYYNFVLGGCLPPLVHRDHSLTWYWTGETPDTTQQAELDAYSHEIALRIAGRFQNVNPEQRVYAGLVPIVPYGEFKSVTWNLGEAGVTTVVSRGVEEIRPFLPSFSERVMQKKTVTLQWPAESLLDRRRAILENARRGGIG